MECIHSNTSNRVVPAATVSLQHARITSQCSNLCVAFPALLLQDSGKSGDKQDEYVEALKKGGIDSKV
jgi:hypothetical protein